MSRPFLCDFCTTEVEAGELFEHGPFRYLNTRTRELTDVERGAFLGCESCADLFKRHRFAELAGVVAAVLGSKPADRREFQFLYERIHANLTGTRHVTKADRPEVPRFAEHVCLCGQKTIVDQRSYETSTKIRCARCGLETILVSKRV